LGAARRAPLEAGAILTGEQMVSDEILLRSEFYLDFLRPLDVRYRSARADGDPEPLSVLSAGRPAPAGRSAIRRAASSRR